MNTYKFRLYPTKTQKYRLEESLEICRQLYNSFIFESRLAYKEGYKIKFDELQRIIPLLLKEEKPKVYSKVAQMVLWQFYNNFSTLAALSKRKQRIGSLRFKPKQQYNSINYNQSGFQIIDNNVLKLSKIGKIRIHMHRKIIGKIKQIIIKKELHNWSACVITDSHFSQICSLNRNKMIGLDLGISNFVYDSDGRVTKHPQFLRKLEPKLKLIQRRLSRKTPHSSNYFKQKLKLGKIHTKIKNKRSDFLHKLSHFYIINYDTIFVEDLQIAYMIKNHHLAKSIGDSAWNSFIKKLEYKAERAGILFLKISPHGTSQKCSSCGAKVPKTLADRIHKCTFCGLEISRDYNSALNILKKGIASLPMGCRKVTPVEIVPLPCCNNTRQELSLNQEIHVSCE